MFIYSEKINFFIQEIRYSIKDILSHEVKLKVTRDRFFDKNQQFSYPISVVIYNDRTMLGYFDANFLEIGIHERLMYASKKQLHDLIRHELAHYLTFIQSGQVALPHGPEFKDFCKSVGWGEEIYNATMSLTEEQKIEALEDSDIFRKIQKLLALATSSNKHEAELAMIKSQQLLLKHNLESRFIDTDDKDKVFLKRLIKQPKKTAKMRSIAKILETFFVSVVFNRNKEGTHLEILGTAMNVQIAEYVADILQDKLEDLWDMSKKEYNLKGAIAKNSFFYGVAKGYSDKISALKRSYQTEVTSALIILEKALERGKEIAYKRLVSSKSSGHYCRESSELGEKAGKGLSINLGIGKSSKKSEALIEYQH
ncbi:MAG: DUF2786 domain-containing protein [Chlamydiae bacterium]|nr:DUF2786 domain-containing protein [Chlamydiota bacterium]